MNGKIFYINNDSELIASVNTPVVRQKIPQVSYPADAYDDYGVSGLYSYPSFNFSILLIVLGVIFLIVQFVIMIGGIFFFIAPKKSIKCRKCGAENYRIKGEFPENCVYCGTRLRK